VLLSRLAQIEGKLNISESQIQQAADLTPLEAPDYIRQEVVSQEVRTYLAFDQLDSAESALKSSSQISNEQFPFIDFPQRHKPSATPGESVSPSLLLLYNSHLLVMLYRARIESDPAGLKKVLEATNRVIEWSMKNKVTIVALETRLIRAQVSNLLGDYAASTEDYLKAVDLGEPGGIIATFLERGKTVEKDLREIARKSTLPAKRMAYIQRILAEFKRCGPLAETTDSENAPIRDRQAGLIEPLSDRELEVLSLISEGLKYREVGLRLFISQNTVRFHIKSIYGKLEVNNRTQAVHKAHQLRIL
jgi:DNA-binding NarL/FixJ family response regulator